MTKKRFSVEQTTSAFQEAVPGIPVAKRLE